jgi:hypothetical protein
VQRIVVGRNGKKFVAPFGPGEILHFVNCNGPVLVRGNGAIFRAADGLRFGTFDPVTGRSFGHSMPFFQAEFVASPYLGMIVAEGFTGSFEVSDLELDGNFIRLVVGGPYGDRGWQIPGSGIRLIRNSGSQRLRNLKIHRHALDGITISDFDFRTGETVIADVICEQNARQGCSLTAGRNYSFQRCRFVSTGRLGLRGSPGAGVDIESDGKSEVRNVAFSDCDFSDNAGVGLIADSGNSAEISFARCRFVGTTNWSAWPNKPAIRFRNCTFIGALVHAHGDPNPLRATEFLECQFLDDPNLSPTKQVYFGANVRHPIVNLPEGLNVKFNRCSFRLTANGGLPLTKNVIYSDCKMSQTYPVPSHPCGTFTGINTLNGPIDLSGAQIHGEVVINGNEVA